MSNHLSTQADFVKSFSSFQTLLFDNGIVMKDEENVCRLFDIWLANHKDERVLSVQMKKEPWQDEDRGF